MSLQSDIVWLMDRVEDAPPRIHSRGVWHDRRDGLGSRLGAPALNRAFEAMIEAPGTITRTEPEQVRCFHAFRQEGDLCPDCSARDENGVPLADVARDDPAGPVPLAPARHAGPPPAGSGAWGPSGAGRGPEGDPARLRGSGDGSRGA